MPQASSSLAPTGSPSPAFTPTEVSSQWRTVKGEGFTIGVPARFRETTRTASNETTMYLFDAPRSTDEDVDLVRVAVLRDVEPTSNIVDQSYVLEQLHTREGDPLPVRSTVEWPGAEEAILVQWTSPVGGEDGARRETWQLMVQVDAKLILNVVAVAPEGSFEELELPEIVSTFKVA